jgi:FkbM family methyltransferase
MYQLDNGQTRYGRMVWPPKDQYIGRSLKEYGEFSPGEAWIFKQLIPPESTVIEVGAHCGPHTLLFARLAKDVVVFELQKELCRLLKVNCVLNDIVNVEVVNAAVGRVNVGQYMLPPLNYGGDHNFGCLGLDTKFANAPKDAFEAIQMVTIDDYVWENGVGFMKVDVEGWETDVLMGARKTIRTHHPILYLENDRPDRAPRLLEEAESLGYELWWHVTPLFAENNFNHNPHNYFGNIVSFNVFGVHPSHNLKVSGVRVTKENCSLAESMELSKAVVFPTVEKGA